MQRRVGRIPLSALGRCWHERDPSTARPSLHTAELRSADGSETCSHRACRLKYTPFLWVQRIIHGAAVNTSSPCCYAACSYRVISLKDNRLIAQPIRFLTLRSQTSPRRRDSLPVGRNRTARTGRGRLLPRRPQRGGGFLRRWIRRHSPMRIGPMVVRQRLGSRTQTAIL